MPINLQFGLDRYTIVEIFFQHFFKRLRHKLLFFLWLMSQAFAADHTLVCIPKEVIMRQAKA